MTVSHAFAARVAGMSCGRRSYSVWRRTDSTRILPPAPHGARKASNCHDCRVSSTFGFQSRNDSLKQRSLVRERAIEGNTLTSRWATKTTPRSTNWTVVRLDNGRGYRRALRMDFTRRRDSQVDPDQFDSIAWRAGAHHPRESRATTKWLLPDDYRGRLRQVKMTNGVHFNPELTRCIGYAAC
jgi:hypothetical protein